MAEGSESSFTLLVVAGLLLSILIGISIVCPIADAGGLPICNILPKSEGQAQKNLGFSAQAGQKQDPCWEKSDPIAHDNCIYSYGRQGGFDPSYCFFIKDKERQAVCVHEAARSLGKPEICDNIPKVSYVAAGEHTYSSPRAECYAQFAALRQDATFCQKLDGAADLGWCHFDLAKSSLSPAVCEKVPSIFPGRPHGFVRDACFDHIARNALKSDYCKQIMDSDTKSRCIAEVRLDASLCKEIKSEISMQLCVWKVAKESKNADLCNMLENDEYSRYRCRADVLADKKQCLNILDPTGAYACNSWFDSDLKYRDYGKTLQSCQAGDENCYYQAAVATLDKEACLPIDDWSAYNDCMQDVQIATMQKKKVGEATVSS